MRDVYSISTLAKSWNVPEKNIRNCIKLNRLNMDDNNKINIKEFSQLYNEDQKLISMDEVFIGIESSGWILSNVTKNKIIKEIENKNNWGYTYYASSNLLISTEKMKSPYYFLREKEVKNNIEQYIIRNLDSMPVENAPILWQRIDSQSAQKLVEVFGVKEGEINRNCQPYLHRLMTEIIKTSKPITEWEQPECQLFERRHPEVASVAFLRKFVMTKGTEGAKKYFKMATILKFERSDIDEKAYSTDQYLTLGLLLFSWTYLKNENILTNIRQSSECAQAILYMAMHIVCGWRRGDILRINLPENIDITNVYNDFEAGNIPHEQLAAVWLGFRFKYENFAIASKNGGDLHFACSVEMGAYMGLYLVMCEHYRIIEQRSHLLNPSAFDKLSVYQKALGLRNYEMIFGREIFRSKQMNKAFLTEYATVTAKKFKNMHFRSMPEILAAYLRGHKIDLDRGQQTIFHYVQFSSEGLTLNEVAMALFQIGTLGFYKHKVLESILPGITEYNLAEKAEMISAATINVEETEEELNSFLEVLDRVESINELPTSQQEFLQNKVMAAVVYGIGSGKEENVFCLYNALHGKGNRACAKQQFCTNCTDKNAYGSLCKYAIYNYEYVFQISMRLKNYKNRIQEYDRQIMQMEQEGNYIGGEELLKLRDLEVRRMESTEDAMEQFLYDENFPIMMRKDMAKLYLGEDSKNVLGTI